MLLVLPLFDFFVKRVFTAISAEFLRLQPVRVLLFILGFSVIPVLADRAFERDYLSHKDPVVFLSWRRESNP
jgi:hypothetical protein